MCGVREAGRVSGISDRLAGREFASPALQPQPQDVRSQRNAHRRCEDVQETRRRELHAGGQRIERHVLLVRQTLGKHAQHTPDTMVDHGRPAVALKGSRDPRLNGLCAQTLPWAKLGAPLGHSVCIDDHYVMSRLIAEAATQIALSIDKRNQDVGSVRIDLVPRVRLHEDCATVVPSRGSATAKPQRSRQGKHELHAMVPVQVAPRSRAPHEQRPWTRKRLGVRARCSWKQHQRILARVAAAGLFKIVERHRRTFGTRLENVSKEVVMAPFVVMLTVLGFSRALGWIGWRAAVSWRVALRVALAAMFVFTAVTHFHPQTRPDLVRMVPPALPSPELLVTLTGVLELAGAAGLLMRSRRNAAAVALMVLLAAMFPANVYAAHEGLLVGGQPASPLFWRLPLQLFWMWALWWVRRDDVLWNGPRQIPTGEREKARPTAVNTDTRNTSSVGC